MPFHTVIREEQIHKVILHGLGMTTKPIPDYPSLHTVEFYLLPQYFTKDSRPRAEWGMYETTDEGYSSSTTEVRYHNGKWYLESKQESRDCDGPTSMYNEYESEGGLELDSRESKLTRIKSRVRDVYAERMGY